MPNFTEPDELALAAETDREPTVPGVRSPEEYAARHLPGAVNIPVGAVAERLGELPRDRPVVTYCLTEHPGASRGARAAELLQARGFKARVLNGGLPAWAALNSEPGEGCGA